MDSNTDAALAVESIPTLHWGSIIHFRNQKYKITYISLISDCIPNASIQVEKMQVVFDTTKKVGVHVPGDIQEMTVQFHSIW